MRATTPQADHDTVDAILDGLADNALKLQANAEANGYGRPTLAAATQTLLEGLVARAPELAAQVLARLVANGYHLDTDKETA